MAAAMTIGKQSTIFGTIILALLVLHRLTNVKKGQEYWPAGNKVGDARRRDVAHDDRRAARAD